MSAPNPGVEERIRASLQDVRQRIAGTCARAGRRSEDVLLVAISKTVPVDVLRVARSAGIGHFGENRAAELAAKAPLVEATWHFVGKLQRGTSSRIADLAHVIHSAEPGSALERVSRRAASRGRRLDCLIQVDFAGGRQGVPPDELEAFAARAAELEGIRLTGLMTLPPFSAVPEQSRPYFRQLHVLLEGLKDRFPTVRELSMGMSADLEIAIEEGATMVRVGTALFGPRRSWPRGEGD